MGHTQLQATSRPSATSAEWVFEVALPQIFRRRARAFRKVGGRYGIVVSGRQWLLDLDGPSVSGRSVSAVEEAEDVIAVVEVEQAALVRTVRAALLGTPAPLVPARVVIGSAQAFDKVVRALFGASSSADAPEGS